MYALLLPLLAAILNGIMNVIDKFVITHRAKSVLGYTIIVGVANILLALLMMSFLQWHNVTLQSMLVPTVVGLLYAGNMYFYYSTLETEDISHVVGFLYLYPVLVAGLSFIFLQERLSLIEYLGASLAVIGVLLLSVRARRVHLQANVWFIVIGIVAIALTEFLMKLATTSISPWNGAAITYLAFGIGLACGCIHPRARAEARTELHNLGWAILPQVFDLSTAATLYAAMALLPATVVASVSSVQPLFVLLFEWTAERQVGQMVKDRNTLAKLVAIGMIVLGIALMYSVRA